MFYFYFVGKSNFFFIKTLTPKSEKNRRGHVLFFIKKKVECGIIIIGLDEWIFIFYAL
jgi:hypothetical protein